MSLTLSETIEVTNHRSGVRARYRYTFSSGRVVNIGPCSLPSTDDVEAKKAALEPDAIAQAAKLDSFQIIESDGPITASGEASKADVAKQYLRRAMATSDSVSAYYKLKRFNDFRIAEGYTVKQIKTALSLTDEQWSEFAARWTYLSSNSTTIDAFKVVQDNDPGAN